MALTATTSNPGDSAKANTFNELFTKLNTLRLAHLERADITGTANTNLSRAFVNAAVVSSEIKTDAMTSVKTAVQTIEKNALASTTRFSSQITIPTVGQLLKASEFNIVDSAIVAMGNECARCSHNAADYRSFNRSFNSSHNSNFSHFTNKGFNNSRCTRYGNGSCTQNSSNTSRQGCFSRRS